MLYFHTLAHEVSVCDPITDTHQMLLRRVWLRVMEGERWGAGPREEVAEQGEVGRLRVCFVLGC